LQGADANAAATGPVFTSLGVWQLVFCKTTFVAGYGVAWTALLAFTTGVVKGLTPLFQVAIWQRRSPR